MSKLVYIVCGLLAAVITWVAFIHEDCIAPEQQFHAGDKVMVRLDKRPGLVVKTYWSPGETYKERGWYYTVRVQATEYRTDTHFFSNDGPVGVSPYSEVQFREFELEAGWPGHLFEATSEPLPRESMLLSGNNNSAQVPGT